MGLFLGFICQIPKESKKTCPHVSPPETTSGEQQKLSRKIQRFVANPSELTLVSITGGSNKSQVQGDRENLNDTEEGNSHQQDW